jgi:hypothetical protein
MKVTFEGASIDEIQQLLALSSAQSGTILTKEFFMSTMKDVTDQLSADRAAFAAYVAKRDASDADLQNQLKDAAATIVTDEAQLADLHSQIDGAFAAAKALGDDINPPPVVAADPAAGADAGATPAADAGADAGTAVA